MLNPAHLLLYPSVNKPTTNSGTMGGAASATATNGGAAGEIFPRLAAPPAGGTLDTDWAFQYQKGHWGNTSGTNDLLNAKAYLANALIRPPSGTGRVFVVLRNAADAGKLIRVWGNVGGVIVPETIATPTATGTGSATQGALATFAWIERVQLLAGTSPYGQAYAAGAIEIWWGTNIATALKLGCIPAPSPSPGPAWGWATGEVRMLGTTGLDDTGTRPSRIDPPAGTFTVPNSYATGLDVQGAPGSSLTQGHKWAFYAGQFLQPGMPPADQVQYAWAISGDSGA